MKETWRESVIAISGLLYPIKEQQLQLKWNILKNIWPKYNIFCRRFGNIPSPISCATAPCRRFCLSPIWLTFSVIEFDIYSACDSVLSSLDVHASMHYNIPHYITVFPCKDMWFSVGPVSVWGLWPGCIWPDLLDTAYVNHQFYNNHYQSLLTNQLQPCVFSQAMRIQSLSTLSWPLLLSNEMQQKLITDYLRIKKFLRIDLYMFLQQSI